MILVLRGGIHSVERGALTNASPLLIDLPNSSRQAALRKVRHVTCAFVRASKKKKRFCSRQAIFFSWPPLAWQSELRRSEWGTVQQVRSTVRIMSFYWIPTSPPQRTGLDHCWATLLIWVSLIMGNCFRLRWLRWCHLEKKLTGLLCVGYFKGNFVYHQKRESRTCGSFKFPA